MEPWLGKGEKELRNATEKDMQRWNEMEDWMENLHLQKDAKATPQNYWGLHVKMDMEMLWSC